MRCALLAGFVLGLVPAEARAAHVVFDHPGYRLTSIGERLTVTARVVDAQNRTMLNAPLLWRIADPTVATVTPQGVVVSKRAGYTWVWAISGRDSASAYIMVDQWPAKLGFAPAALEFDAIGLGSTFHVETRDAAGHAIADAAKQPASCKILDARIAKLTITPHGDSIAALDNGVTYVRCADRGIADSLRVEVRQQAATASIQQKASLSSKTVGDTFRVVVKATDRNRKSVDDVHPTWASLSPSVVSVNPVTGLARSVGPGAARIVAQVDDAADTVDVNVGASRNSILLQSAPEPDSARADVPPPASPSSSPAPSPPPAAAAAPAVTHSVTKEPTLGITVAPPVVADTTQPVVAGTEVTNAAVEGQAAGHFNRAKFTDSASKVMADAQTRNQHEIDSVSAFILRGTPVARAATGRFLSVSGVGELASYSSHTSAFAGEPDILQQETGSLVGAAVDVVPYRWLAVSGDVKTGTLNCLGGCEALSVTEVSGLVTIPRGNWLALQAGYGLRAESDQDGLQRWELPRLGVVTRFAFVGGAINTVVGVSAFPGASFSVRADSPSLLSSLGGDAGLECRTGVFTESLVYHVDRFSFAGSASAPSRVDQFSTLQLRIGLRRDR